VRALAFSADGGLLVAGGMGPADPNSAGTDGKMRIEAFDTATGKSLAAHHPPDSKGMLMSMFLHDGGPWMIAAGGGGQNGVGFGGICLWDPKRVDKDKKPVAPVHHKSPLVIRGIVPNSDGKSLLTVGTLKEINAGRIEVWGWTEPVLPSKK
jgi:hypothetical protein